MTEPGGGGRATEADAASTRRRGLLRQIFLYGSSRGVTEGLWALRGLALATLLGPTRFGVWTLFRLGSRYASFGELGVRRGLEFEVSRTRADEGASVAPYGRAAVGFLTVVFIGLGALALAVSFLTGDPTTALVLRVLALGVLIERLWQYGLTYLRATHSLRLFAVLEVASAGLHLALSTSLAVVWGLPGALVGFLIATLVSLVLVGRHVPIRPAWSTALLRRLLNVGFPVSLTLLATLVLSTVDRLAVAAVGGTTLLGYYAFAAALAGLAGSFAIVVRTVIFPDIYGAVTTEGSERAVTRLMDETIGPYATLFPVVLGVVAFGIGPAVLLVTPQYLEAVAPARLFLFHGAAMGFSSLGTLGLVAASRQWLLPALAGVAAVLNGALATGLLSAGLGLEAVAAEALVVRVAYGGSVLAFAAGSSTSERPWRMAARTVLPIVYCASVVFAIGRVFPGTDWRSALFSAGVYLVAMLPLVPLLLRTLADVRR